jgi:orotate phosphoribosyltransferase
VKKKKMKFSMEKKHFLIRLREIGAIKVGEKTKLKDGSLSPIYVDLRKPLFNNPNLLWLLGDFFSNEIRKLSEYPDKVQCVIGVPEAGKPLATATSLYTGAMEFPYIPLVILRSQPKAYGTQKGSLIIGEINNDWEYNLLDDVITTSESKRAAIETLKKQGIEVERTIVAFDREQGGGGTLIRDGYEFEALFEILDVAEFYLEEELITQEQYNETIEFIETHQFD